MELICWEELDKEFLELLKFYVFANTLLAVYQFIEPLIILFLLELAGVELIPDAFQCRDIYLHFIAQLINKPEQVQDLSYNEIPIWSLLVVLDGFDNNLIDILLS